jgi:hypothetical protein
MKYSFLPKLMWAVFKGDFQRQLSFVLAEESPKTVMRKAHKKYREILQTVDEFDKGDAFVINILSGAMLAAVLLSVEKKYSVEEVRAYYKTAMNSNYVMQKATRSKKYYTEKGRQQLKERAEKSRRCTNPYSWKFTVEDGKTINEYTATFYTCGLCHLFARLGLSEYISAMCAYDHDMAAMNHTEFSRQYTLAGGGPYCDCHYKHESERRGKRL